ncbi:hypothetical protein NMY22_g9588 [Coprinellus aureogranulatus]|nr:hypothetical protein NMY22_g9588 [Coprinellus aureogranulatus]
MRVRPTPTLPIVHHKLRHLVLALSEDLIKAVMQNVQLPAMRSLQVITAYTASPFASGVVPQWVFPFLHRVSWKHPLFWPQLRQFSFGSDISPCILERGDGDFEQFKADPSAWAERRGF